MCDGSFRRPTGSGVRMAEPTTNLVDLADRRHTADEEAAPTAPSPPGHRRVLTAAVLIGAVLVAGLVALVAGPGRGMREDIAAQRDIVAQQLQVTEQQLATTRQQLDVAMRQLAIAEEQRDIAFRQLEIAQRQLEIAEATHGNTEESLALQRELLAIAQATLRQAQELNEKTPDLRPDAGEPGILR
jgi:hypothetical protein